MQSYVATCFLCSSLVFSRNSVFFIAIVLLCIFFNLVSRPSFSCHESISVLVLLQHVSCIIIISVATQKVCRDRVLSPFSLIPYCNFILEVTIWPFSVGDVLQVATPYVMSRLHFLCMQHIFLLRPSFQVVT